MLLNILKEKNRVTIAELVEEFGVSEVSIRNDLAVLEERKLLVRVKGGAVHIHQSSEYDDIPVASKQVIHAREKQLLGAAAAAMVQDRDSIIIDSGTTTMEVAKHLNPEQKLTIITNALDIAITLANKGKFDIIVLGGHVRNVSYSTVGILSEVALKNFYCDKLFLGVDSVNIRDGISTPNIEEASLNQAMLESAKEVIAVFDSSKVDRRGFAHIAMLDRINTVVTDNHIPDSLKEYLAIRGIKVRIVNVDETN